MSSKSINQSNKVNLISPFGVTSFCIEFPKAPPLLFWSLQTISVKNASHFKASTLISHTIFFQFEWGVPLYYNDIKGNTTLFGCALLWSTWVSFKRIIQRGQGNRISPLNVTSFFCVQSFYETPVYLFCHLALNIKLNCSDKRVNCFSFVLWSPTLFLGDLK